MNNYFTAGSKVEICTHRKGATQLTGRIGKNYHKKPAPLFPCRTYHHPRRIRLVELPFEEKNARL
jgi:hypothetical protein